MRSSTNFDSTFKLFRASWNHLWTTYFLNIYTVDDVNFLPHNNDVALYADKYSYFERYNDANMVGSPLPEFFTVFYDLFQPVTMVFWHY